MKIRQKSVCDNCRRRKLGCDGMHPECTQCKWSHQACPGYPGPWTFMPPQVSGSRDAQYNLSSADLVKPASIIDTGLFNENVIQSGQREHPIIVTNPLFEDSSGIDFDRYVARIIECYIPVEEQGRADSNPVDSQPRICGSWVEVMPKMKNDRHPENTMELAVRAFALSLNQTGHDTSTAYRNIFHAYECALGSLRRHLARPACQFRADIAIAILCLGLTELMIPETPTGLTPHIRGVGSLICAQGPQAFQRDILHKLYVGYVPLLIIDCFLSRKPMFIAERNWQQEPFTLNMPSPIQKLFCKASAIPTLLFNVDQFKAESQDSSLAEENVLNAGAFKFSFVSALTNLNEMENELSSQGHRPCQPPPSISKSVEYNHLDRVLWFPGITSANALVYLWLFKIICMTELLELAEFSAPRHVEDEIFSRNLSPASLEHQINELAVLICQSMEYCTQNEMALYGPASAIYPIRIAHKILKSATNYGAHVAYIESIVERLVSKGLRATPYIVFCS